MNIRLVFSLYNPKCITFAVKYFHKKVNENYVFRNYCIIVFKKYR